MLPVQILVHVSRDDAPRFGWLEEIEAVAVQIDEEAALKFATHASAVVLCRGAARVCRRLPDAGCLLHPLHPGPVSTGLPADEVEHALLIEVIGISCRAAAVPHAGKRLVPFGGDEVVEVGHALRAVARAPLEQARHRPRVHAKAVEFLPLRAVRVDPDARALERVEQGIAPAQRCRALDRLGLGNGRVHNLLDGPHIVDGALPFGGRQEFRRDFRHFGRAAILLPQDQWGQATRRLGRHRTDGGLDLHHALERVGLRQGLLDLSDGGILQRRGRARSFALTNARVDQAARECVRDLRQLAERVEAAAEHAAEYCRHRELRHGVWVRDLQVLGGTELRRKQRALHAHVDERFVPHG